MTEQKSARRCLIKISGEAFSSRDGGSLSHERLDHVANELIIAAQSGVQVGVVVGGGNFLRGATCKLDLLERTTKDQIGMLATIMNGLAIVDALNAKGQRAMAFSAVEMPGVVPRFNAKAAKHALESGYVVVCVGGTGNPFCTTDSTAALRAVEMDADCIIKASTVDGVYDKDPNKFEDAVRYDRLTFREALDKRLAIMDLAAFTQCETFNMPILVLDCFAPSAMSNALMGEPCGTLITKE